MSFKDKWQQFMRADDDYDYGADAENFTEGDFDDLNDYYEQEEPAPRRSSRKVRSNTADSNVVRMPQDNTRHDIKIISVKTEKDLNTVEDCLENGQIVVCNLSNLISDRQTLSNYVWYLKGVIRALHATRASNGDNNSITLAPRGVSIDSAGGADSGE